MNKTLIIGFSIVIVGWTLPNILINGFNFDSYPNLFHLFMLHFLGSLLTLTYSTISQTLPFPFIIFMILISISFTSLVLYKMKSNPLHRKIGFTFFIFANSIPTLAAALFNAEILFWVGGSV